MKPLREMLSIKCKRTKINFTRTKLAVSRVILRQDKYNTHSSPTAVNGQLKNYCGQKGNNLVDNKNLKEEHLGIKQLYLNSEGNCLFVKNLLNYIKAN